MPKKGTESVFVSEKDARIAAQKAKKAAERTGGLKIERYVLEVVFEEPCLGSQPTKDVASIYLTNKKEKDGRKRNPDVDRLPEIPEDELAALPDELERGTTVFHSVDGKPVLWDYQLKGFLKEAAKNLNCLRGVKNLRSKIGNYVFFRDDRMIRLVTPEGWAPESEGEQADHKERPLLAQTMQGPRVCLARSEMLPAGTRFSVRVQVLSTEITEELLRDLLDYGAFKGIGQWANGGWGRFVYTLTKVEG